MEQTALQANRQMSLIEIVFSLGMKPGNFKHALSDCFDMKLYEKESLTKKLSGFSRTLSSAIPSEIDMKYQSPQQLISHILTNKKIEKSAAYRHAPETIQIGIPMAVSFLIVRDHPEAEKYPPLMEMRQAIEAVKQVHKATARGSHKGESGTQVIDAVNELINSKDCVVLTRNQFLPFFEMASKLSLLGDKKAKQALLSYHEITEEETNG